MEEVLEPLLARADRPYDIPLNVAIWISFKPIIKIYLSIGAGFLLAKLNILTPHLAKGISRLVLLCFLPCLIFNNIVSQIKDTDIKIFGVVIFSGFIYYVVGLGWGLIVRCFTPIPRAWFGGLLLCCMLNNCSDLPLAYVQTIGTSPLLPAGIAARGVSYCVLMVIVFTIFNFNLGGTRLVEWDATRIDPQREEPTIPWISWASTKSALRHLRDRSAGKSRSGDSIFKKERKEETAGTSSSSVESKKARDLEAQRPEEAIDSDHEDHEPYNDMDHMAYVGRTTTSQSQIRARAERPFGSTDVFYARTRHGSLVSEDVYADAPSSLVPLDDSGPIAYQNMALSMARSRTSSFSNRSQRLPAIDTASSIPNNNSNLNNAGSTSGRASASEARSVASTASKEPTAWRKFKRSWYTVKDKNKVTRYICNFFEDLFLPQMIALILGITVCMIPWVRRVFVNGQHIAHFHDAPDHMPPLSFLMDFLAFFAGAQVPLGLMLLGGTIASLRVGKMVPGFWKSLVMIVVFKLALLPIIGCAWIHRIREIGWIDKNDPIIPIVLAVSAGTPSATVQIYLTLSWMDPTKESVELNCLAIALMAQYALLPITLTFTMTYVVMHFV